MPRYLPISLNLEGRLTVIIGGGNVGTQKVRDLLTCDARVTVVSPVASDYIQAEAAAGRITWHPRRYQPGDLDGAFLVICATDDPVANIAVYEAAQATGQLVNVCDDPPHCNYIFPATIHRGPLTLSIFTHGTSPALSKRVRRELERAIGPEFGALAQALAELRPRVLQAPGLTQPQRQAIFERILYSDALYLFAEGSPEAAHARVASILEEMLPATE